MIVLVPLALAELASAQRVRLNDSYVIPNGQIAPPTIVAPQPGYRPNLPQQVYSPQQTVLPNLQNPFPAASPQIQPGGFPTAPPTIIQQPAFDPFAVQPQAFPGTPSPTLPPNTYPGSFPGAFPGGVIGPPGGTQQPIQPPPYIYPPPAGGVPPALPNQQGFYPQGYGQPQGYGNYGYGGNGSWANSAAAWPSQAWARLRSSNVYRLLERPRWRHTYLAPDSSAGSRGLGLNESDIATTLTLPNFLFTSQPIRLSPGFIFHFWEGPDSVATGADLPGRTHSAYLASDFSTPWDRQLGAELNLTVGLYTDFDHVTTDSIRITGLGLGWFRLNNTTTFKAGVEYLDRVRVKLLPAVGFFIYPTPDLKLDVYFPRPKLAQRLPNLGNYEVWGYIGGEYGGGSWTIRRMGGMGDQVDVNDIRTFIGLEWVGPRRVTGFFEAGYVFDREIIYKSAPNIEIDIDDTYMIRAGIAF